MKKQYFVLLVSVLCVIPLRIHAETARGVFGIPTVESVEPSTYGTGAIKMIDKCI